MKSRIALLFVAILFVTAAFAQDKTVAAAKTEKPKLYTPSADAKADIAAAVAKAKKENKHVFIQVGGNWCSWCILFHNLVEATPGLHDYLNSNYVPVLLNYSEENKNLDVLASLSNPGRFGFPVFVILDGDGKLIHTQNSGYLEEGKGHSPKKVMEFLEGWTVDAMKPEKIQ